MTAAAVLDCVPVFAWQAAGGWGPWKPRNAGTTLKSVGEMEFETAIGNPGIDSELILLETGGLHRVRVLMGANREPCEFGPSLRLSDVHGEPMGPVMQLDAGESQCWFFIPHRTRAVKLSIFASAPGIGVSMMIGAVAIDQIEAETYYRQESHGRRIPVIASMASIPSRRRMLRDAFESLLLQCDLVRVFLNQYEEVPRFLDHPRAQVRRSQERDDKGDAGKFGWLDVADEPGFRIVADDDLLFPPDFVRRMLRILERYDNHAIAAVHGVLVKDPFVNYYDQQSRSVSHFQEPLEKDRTVHVLGTNALIYHSASVNMTWDDFMYRNMADIFLARHAQRHRIPMICVERPRYWVRQNKQPGGFATIYESSLRRNQSPFDSSLVQDGVLKHLAPLTIQPTTRPKVAVCVLATRIADVDACIQSWAACRSDQTDWVLIVATGTWDPDLGSHVAAITSPTELHIVSAVGLTPTGCMQKLLALAVALSADGVCLALDCVRFTSDEWTRLLGRGAGALRISPALCRHASSEHWHRDFDMDRDSNVPVMVMLDPQALTRLNPGRAAGDALRALLDAGARQQAAAVIDAETAAILARSFELADAQAALDRLAAAPSTAPDCPLAVSPRAAAIAAAPAARAINDLFERVLVINLDRRPDRWQRVGHALDRAGIEAERFRAVDGTRRDLAAEYAAYAAQPLATVGNGVRPVTSSREFYLDYDSQRARVAFVEAASGRKAIASQGAWAYLKSWEQILERALIEQVETLLVFDDDVVFHKDAAPLFAQAAAELPDDWLMLQLGTMQFHWESDWMSPRGRFLYQTNGSAVGSHAVGIRYELVPFLLDHVRRRELPFDTGAVAAAARAYRDRCLVMYPNIAIQRFGDSDIRTSNFQATRDHSTIAKTHRWMLEDYVF